MPYEKKTDNPNMGRPRIDIDWSEFDKLCAIQCTLMEIASWFDCSEDTIELRVKDTYGVTFTERFKQKAGKGKISLRRIQWKMAEKNPTMALWLGKQYLNQKDRQETIFGAADSIRKVSMSYSLDSEEKPN